MDLMEDLSVYLLRLLLGGGPGCFFPWQKNCWFYFSYIFFS